MTLSKLRVLVVDGSARDGATLADILRAAPDFEVVGRAELVEGARNRIRARSRCVITLDVSMEGRGGIRLLNNQMRLRPTPIVLCSPIPAATAVALQALRDGIIHFVPKVHPDRLQERRFRERLVQAVRLAAYSPAAAG